MVFRFGIFEFDDQSGELRRNGRAVALEPQPARALACLLSRPGDLVTREELRDAVWGADTHVDFDRGLAYCLSQIRAALGDSAENPRFVQTLPEARLQVSRAGRRFAGSTGRRFVRFARVRQCGRVRTSRSTAAGALRPWGPCFC